MSKFLPESIPIAEAARRLNISSKTLRRWEKKGLLLGSRTPGGHRRYQLSDLERITQLKRQKAQNQKLGFFRTHKDYVPIQEASKHVDVSTKTLRRWEARGLISSERTSGGHRRYLLPKIEETAARIKKEQALHHPSPKPPREIRIPPQVPIRVREVSEVPVLYQSLHVEQKRVLSIILTFFVSFLLSASAVKVATDRLQKGQGEAQIQAGGQKGAAVLAEATGPTTLNVNVETNFNEDVKIKGKLLVPGGQLAPDAKTLAVGGAATTLSLGGAAGTTTINNNLAVTGTLSVSGDFTKIRGITYSFPSSQGSASTYLKNDSTGTLSWATVSVPSKLSDLSGTLGISNGGTGITSYTTGDVLYASSATALSKLAIGTSGQILTVSGGLPTWSAAPASGSFGFWQRNSTVVSPATITDDLAIGGTTAAAATFYVTASSGNVRVASGASIAPTVNLGADLGTTSLRFNNLYVGTVNSNSTLSTTGQALFTYTPLDTTYGQSSVMINPTTAPTNSNLLGIGIAGAQRAGIDAEGDITLGYAGAPGSSVPTSGNPLNIYNHSTTNLFNVDTSGNLISKAGINWEPLTNAVNALNIANAAGSPFVSFDTTNSRVGIGTTGPAVLLTLSGTDQNIAGPHTEAFTSTDLVRPVFQNLNWTHDNLSLNFDSYFTGSTWTSSSSTNNFQIYKLTGLLRFRYANAVTAGNTITWNEGIVLNSSGNVGIGDSNPGTTLSVNGIISGPSTQNLRLQATGATAGSGNNGSIYFLDSSGTTRGRFATTAVPFGAGTGNDGPCTVSSALNLSTGTCVGRANGDAVATNITAAAAIGATSLTVASTTGFAPNDEILVAQMTGTGAGNYDIATVSSVPNGTTINISTGLIYAYQSTAAQVVRIPNYSAVTINASQSITSNAWNAATGTGGVLFVRVSGTFTNNGTVDQNSKGGAGGSTAGGGAGGTAVSGTNGSDSNGNPGTVGTAGNIGTGPAAGSGGGAAGGGGAGTTDTSNSSGGAGGGSGGGGGGGGYRTDGQSGDQGSSGGNGGTAGTAGGTGGTAGTKGTSGTSLGDLSTNYLFIGSGGGSGGGGGGGGSGACSTQIGGDSCSGGAGGAGSTSGAGGAGGGIVVIAATTLTNNSTIRANGAVGSAAGAATAGSAGTGANGFAAAGSGGGGYGGGGGGGAGGTVWLFSNTLTLGTVQANGGASGGNPAAVGGSNGVSGAGGGVAAGGGGGATGGSGGLNNAGSATANQGFESQGQGGGNGGPGASGVIRNQRINTYGTLYAGSLNTVSADLAEYYISGDKTLSPGDVVKIADISVVNASGSAIVNKGVLLKADKPYDQKLLGIISTSPGVTLGSIDGATGQQDSRALALSGRVPVKIAPDSAPILIGDFLTSSDTHPGMAMKATKTGYTVAKALESWDSSTSSGQIEAFVSLGYYLGPMTADGYINTDANFIANSIKVSLSSNDQLRLFGQSPTVLSTATDSASTASESAVSHQPSAISSTSNVSVSDAISKVLDKLQNLEGEISLLKAATVSATPSQSLSSSLPSLTVLGNSLLSDTVVNGKLNVGVLSFDNKDGSLQAIGPLKLQPLAIDSIQFAGNTIEMDKNGNLNINKGVISGNSSLRDVANISPGQTSISVVKSWDKPPVSIQATPSYKTSVWITKISNLGFTINVSDSPTSDEKLYWFAIW